MAAAQGATLRELMERMGHSSTRAASIYLHATRERDQRIAASMGQLFKDATDSPSVPLGTRPTWPVSGSGDRFDHSTAVRHDARLVGTHWPSKQISRS